MNKYLFAFLPYISIIIGLYFLSDAFLTLIFFQISIIFSFIFIKPDIKKLFNGWHKYLGLGLILTVIIFSFLAIFVATKYLNLEISDKIVNYNLTKVNFIIFTILFILINPAIEELFWRQTISSEKVIYFEDFMFGFYHSLVLFNFVGLFFSIIIGLFLTAVSVFWKFLNKTLDGLLIPYLMHLVADLAVIVLILFN